MLTELLIAPDVGSGALLEQDGAPVWPIHDPADAEALEAVAAIYGAAVRMVSPRAERSAPPLSDGAVWALSAALEAPARLYAHLAGRPYGGHESPPRCLAVVIGYWHQLSPALLAELYSAPGKTAPGIIAATSRDELWRAILVKSAAARLRPSRSLAPLAFFPYSQQVASPGVFARGASASEIRRVLEGPSSVLTIVTHADGIDASLGELVLCTTDRPATGDRRPGCVDSGYCHRLRTQIEDAHRSGQLVAPELVQARVLVFGVCWGLMTQPAMVAPRWSLGARLIQSSTIGAIATAWRAIPLHPQHVYDLAGDLARGKPIGEAVARHNADPRTIALGNDLCILGDPAVVACDQPGPALTFSIAPPVESQWVDVASIGFLQKLMVKLANSSNAAACALAAERLDFLSSLAWQPTYEGSAQWDRATCDLVLQPVLQADGKLVEISRMLAARVECSTNTIACFVCGSTSELMIAEFGAKGYLRETVKCPICGVVRDQRSGASDPLTVQFDGANELVLSRAIRQTAAAGIVISNHRAAERRVISWPTEQTRIAIPGPLPAGLFAFTILVLEREELTALRIPARIGQPTAGFRDRPA